MKISENGFMIPEYTDIAAIPALVEYNIGVLEKLIADGAFCKCVKGEVRLIDGGGYADVSGKLIDGGSYADVSGELIDGGKYGSY